MQERNRLDTKFIERFRQAEPETAVMHHLLTMWVDNVKPNLEDPDTIGSVVSNIYNDDDDYLVVTENAMILVGKSASVTYGTFDGYSSGNKTRKQIVDGLTREPDYTIYKIHRQISKDTKRPVLTLLNVDHVDIVNRLVYSDEGYGFHMDEIELDRDTNQFVVKELFFDGLQYMTKHGTFVKNIIPRKVTQTDESNSNVSPVNSRSLHETIDDKGSESDQTSIE